jgi:hypothetical protein
MNKPNSPDYGKHLLVRGVYFTRRPKIDRKDISQFVNMLHDVQQEYLEEAVEKSGYKEANEVIKHIMELK